MQTTYYVSRRTFFHGSSVLDGLVSEFRRAPTVVEDLRMRSAGCPWKYLHGDYAQLTGRAPTLTKQLEGQSCDTS